MFRVLFLAATAAALAGCASSDSATQAKFRADDAKCKSYGAEHGTDLRAMPTGYRYSEGQC
jgi:uncharacterized membrane protein